MADYTLYTNYVERITNSRDLSSFKRHPDYTNILEHLSYKFGLEYKSYIQNTTPITNEETAKFCELNDSVGNPAKEDFGFVVASPSSLRYVFQAHLILSYLQKIKMPNLNMVEVGGGYGGLCLAIHFFAKKYNINIDTYTVIDLPSISNLQKLYLNTINYPMNVRFVDATTFGAEIDNKDMFLVSNYCFSEISGEYQKRYIELLFPKVSHGFMAWNWIPVYDFGFKTSHTEEYPNTGGPFNRYLYF
jgi:hypothetical protein